MKRITLFLLTLFVPALAFAQRETFDIATFTPPAGWTKDNSRHDVVVYVTGNVQTGIYCQIGVYASSPSEGTLQADFEHDWQQLVVNPFHPSEAPQLTPIESGDGWQVRMGYATFEYGGSKSVAMLTTSSGHGKCVSIIVVTNTDEYQTDIEKFIESVDLAKPTSHAQPVALPATDTGNSAVVGSWGKSNAVAQLYNRYGSYSYNKQQYTFNSNGTYFFANKNYSEQSDETLLSKESGTYVISGSTITIIPQTSIIEAWTKRDGGDNYKQLVTTQQRPLEKVTYQFTIVDRNLILTATQQTQRDGKFSTGSSYTYGPAGTFTPIMMPAE